MYSHLQKWLGDRSGAAVFTCFGVWHFLYLILIFGGILSVVLLFRNKTEAVKKRVISISLGIALGLYIADFFLMPFAYGEIDPEKLPFHACTATCVLCALSRKWQPLRRFLPQLLLLGLLSNLIYVIYPAGVGWYGVHPLCYRVWQTLLYHGAMTAFGVFALAFGEIRLNWRKWPLDLALLCIMSLWALLGNALYNGLNGRFFNWLFVVRDPFYVLPAEIAPFVMPFLIPLALLGGEMILHAVYAMSKNFPKFHSN